MLPLLAPILIQAGTKVLADIIGKNSPAAAVVVDKLGAALGTVNATPEAIVEKFKADPGAVISAAQEVESADPAMWEYLAGRGQEQADLLKREDEREGFFSWGWRPALSWLLVLLWLWGGLLLPLINAAFHAAIATLSVADLVTFSGIWLAIYGGGHTVKDLAAEVRRDQGRGGEVGRPGHGHSRHRVPRRRRHHFADRAFGVTARRRTAPAPARRSWTLSPSGSTRSRSGTPRDADAGPAPRAEGRGAA